MPDDSLDDEGLHELKDDIVWSLSKAIQQRVEKELEGAWRAGYSYLYVLQPPDEHPTGPGDETITVRRGFVPTRARHEEWPEGYRVEEFDLTSVSDEDILDALNR